MSEARGGDEGAFGGPRRRMTHPRTVGLLPLDALRSADSRARRAILLHSGRLDVERARFSVLARHQGGVQWRHQAAAAARQDPFERLEQVTGDGALWLGFLGYDLARVVERLPNTAAADRNWPDLAFHRCPGWLEHDAADGSWHACGELAGWSDDQVLGSFFLDRRRPLRSFQARGIKPDRPASEHLAAVERALEWIAAGDVFQVNVARRWGGRFRGSTAALYAAMAASAEPWYGAHVPMVAGQGPRHGALCSASPELFLEVDPDGGVITRPIKGTEAAGRGGLEHSPKDAAELAMIVDLLRNDLGRVCRPGSMAVPENRTVEEHPTVRHAVATVSGRLRADQGLAALLRATWPGGSITGAPKVRSMEIIEALEPVRRGPSYGAIGGIRRDPLAEPCSEGWRVKLNLAIRTVCVGNGRFDFHVGGGIVADSQPEAELAETVVKATSMLRALRSGRSGRGR